MRADKTYRTGLYVFLAVLALFFALNVALVIPYALALLIGVMLTVLAKPFYDRLRKKGLGPTLSATLVIVAILLILIGPVASFLTVAINQAIAFGQHLGRQDLFSINVIVAKIGNIGGVLDIFGGAEALEKQIRSGIQSSGKFLTGAVIATAGRIPDFILQLFLALIACFFLLQDGKEFLLWLENKVPLDNDVKKELAQSFKDTSVSVVFSTLAAAAVQAVLMFLAFLLIGVPGGFLAAGATFIFAWIPILGSTPVWVGGIIYLYTEQSYCGMFFMLLAGGITGISDNFVRPVILKGRSNMHPLVSLIAIFGGIQIFGIFGVFIGPILAGILTALLQIWPVIGKRFGILP